MFSQMAFLRFELDLTVPWRAAKESTDMHGHLGGRPELRGAACPVHPGDKGALTPLSLGFQLPFLSDTMPSFY